MAVIELDWRVLNADRAEASIDAQQAAVRQLRREYELLARARRSGGGDSRSTQQAARAQRDAAAAASDHAAAQRDLGNAVQSSSGAFSDFLGNLASGVAFGIADRGLQLIIDALQGLISATIEFGRQSLDVATETRQLERSLTAVLGSSEAATDSLEQITEIANTIGGDIGQLANQFVNLSGATRGTSITLDEINGFLENSARAFQIFGVDAEAADRVFLGLTQSLGRGVIQAEELGQVIENFPAARGIIANGLGVDVQELSTLLRDGTFNAETFFRAFSEGLAQVEGEIDPLQAATAQVNNSLRQIQLNLGDALLTVQTAGTGFLSGILDTAITDEFFDGLAQATQRFSDTLAENPEIAEELGFSLREVSFVITELLIDGIQEFTNILRENPEIIRELGEGIGRLARLADNLARGIGGVLNRLDQLGRAFANTPIVRLGDSLGRAFAGGERSARGIESSIGSLVNLQAEFGSLTESASASLAEQFRNAEATASELERARDAERDRSQIDFQQGQARDRLADRRAVQAEQRAFQQEQAQLQQSLEAQLQQRESAFNEQERLKAQENERAIQQFKEDGARQIELIQSNAAERINRLNEDAAKQIEQARQAGFDDETGRTRIEQLELEAERSLQLEDAKDRRERRRLEEEFEAEDELAQRRFEAFAPVREERERLEAEIAEIERQNQEEVEAVRLQTEQNIADFRQALQETEQEFRLQQEEALATRRQTLEQQLQVERENLESLLEARALAFQTQQENAALEAQFERQRIQREFQAEQRRLDEESAERVAEIRGGVGTGDAAIPRRKTGGPVTAGQPYIVGEAGPEYFVPQHSGQIINHHQSVRIAQQALAQQPILARPLAPSPVVNVQGMSSPEILLLLSAIADNTSMKGGTASQILRERKRL